MTDLRKVLHDAVPPTPPFDRRLLDAPSTGGVRAHPRRAFTVGLAAVLAAMLVAVLAVAFSDGSTSERPAEIPSSSRSGPVTSANRGPVSISLKLPSAVIRTGASMTGTIHVKNRTGHAIDYTHCGSPFQVALGRPGSWPRPAWNACRTSTQLPQGVSTFSVTVVATALACSGMSLPPPDLPRCIGEGQLPPLRPGRYYARLYQAPRLGGALRPIPIRVLPYASQGAKSRDGWATNEFLVFMETRAFDSQVAEVRRIVAASPRVAYYNFVSKEAAFAEFRRVEGRDRPELVASVTAADLPASFDVVAQTRRGVRTLARRLKRVPGVDEVQLPLDPREYRQFCKTLNAQGARARSGTARSQIAELCKRPR